MKNVFAQYVEAQEIYNKLPMCSMFCKHYNDCDKRITLQTTINFEVISVCMGNAEILSPIVTG